ncbi:MAG TPA: ABC transporter permease [Chitinophagales bacterium]|nr:ABC transporter permease [Chitinophagales bacterium]
MSKPDAYIEIKPTASLFNFRIGELIQYRYLLFLFVRRDFITIYKQTILGPLWHILQPLVTTLIFTAVFGLFARIPHDGIPPVLFYLSGMIMWAYFAACLNKTSATFLSNASIFGKVYFPRITVPLASVISSLLSFCIQLILLAIIAFIYRNSISVQPTLLLLPVFVVLVAAIGFGFGIIVSSLTTKYRDLSYAMTFGVQLWMYATPVIYPLSIVPAKFRIISKLNPLTSIIEGFRYSITGKGTFLWHNFIYTVVFALVIVFVGMVLFNRTERDFMDTV